MQTDKPIILLAFANDNPKHTGYLRNLSLELNSLKRSLEKAEDHGLCHLHLLPNATLGSLVHTFQRKKFRDRIAIFHYGGHANSYDLMLEDEEGGLKKAKAEGIIPFLSHQKGLQLVFLNGCFSIKQAKDLVKAGIPAVIGTVNAVNDKIATELSINFYEALAEGSTLDQAWKEATYKIQAQIGIEKIGAYYRNRETTENRSIFLKEDEEGRFPWEIYYQTGNDAIRDWNLAEAAQNPYFGLPQIPPNYHLPDLPYQFLKRYQKRDAKIFFGRGNYIRDLYHRIHNPHTAPIILLYGQSGVGKSSLLEAGLFPRLEAEFELIHLRRDSEKGLIDQLKAALNLEQKERKTSPTVLQPTNIWEETISQLKDAQQNLQGLAQEQLENIIQQLKIKQETLANIAPQNAPTWAHAWLELEARTAKKGVIIIIDQLEEVFTRPISKQKDELNTLLQILSTIFIANEHIPKGKIILSYRKEYDAEIEKAFRVCNLPKEKVFLDKLDATGIEEIVSGLASTPLLKNKYRLNIEEELPDLIAQNLLSDRESPIAPVLQIILTKMWQQENQNDYRLFSIKKYQALRKQGILLDNFFHEQMEKIKRWETKIQKNIETSGLALDILHYHTTHHSTANSRSIDELRMYYQHQSDVLEQLIEKFQTLYLLSSISANHSTLAHDTLAPIVRREIQYSDKPGQRALRILSSKMIDFQRNPEKTFIDEEDLFLVEEGASGMRIWTTKEKALIEKSRKRRAKLEGERRRNKNLKAVGVTIISILLIISSFLWRQSAKESQVNQLISQAFQVQAVDAVVAMRKLDTALNLLPHHSMALEARHDIYTNNEFYQKVLTRDKLSVSWATISPDDSILLTCQGRNLWLWAKDGTLLDSIPLNFIANQALFFPDGKSILISGRDQLLRKYDFKDKHLHSFEGHKAEISEINVSPNGHKILSGDIGGKAILWDQYGKIQKTFENHQAEITTLTFASNKRHWLSGGMDGKLYLYDSIGNPLQTYTFTSKVTSATFTPNASSIVIGLRNGEIQKWTIDGKHLNTYKRQENRINSLQFSPDGMHTLIASDHKSIELWDSSGHILKTYRGHSDFVYHTYFSSDGKYFISASEDGTAKWWKVHSKVQKEIALSGGIQAMAFANKKIIVGLGAKEAADINSLDELDDFFDLFSSPKAQPALIYNSELKEQQVLKGHKGNITALAVHSESKLLATGSDDTDIILWDEIGDQKDILRAHSKTIFSLAISSDGKYLLSGSSDKQAILWSNEGDSLLSFLHPDVVSSLAFIPNTQEFLTGCYDGIIRRWSMKGQLLQEWTSSEATIETIALSPDGKWIACGHGGLTADMKIWDFQANLKMAKQLDTKDKSGGQAVYSVAFTPNSQKIIIGGEGGVVHIFDLEGHLLQTLDDFENSAVYSIIFEPQHQQIICGSADGMVRTFNMLK